MEQNSKFRFKRKDEEDQSWRYALTVAKSGVILSSTTNANRAGTFSEDVEIAVAKQVANPDGPYKKTVVETF